LNGAVLSKYDRLRARNESLQAYRFHSLTQVNAPWHHSEEFGLHGVPQAPPKRCVGGLTAKATFSLILINEGAGERSNNRPSNIQWSSRGCDADSLKQHRRGSRPHQPVDWFVSTAVPRSAPGEIAVATGLKDLPNPVRRYFTHVLPEGQKPIRRLRMSQSGVLRTDTGGTRWMKFRAQHVVDPPARRFSWDAKVQVMPFVHLRVRDAYAEGAGSGEIQLLSAMTVASERDEPELNAAALHRYLAEAVWYPTALLPGAGVQWSPVDDVRAAATLTDGGTTVSLVFRFNEAGEATVVHTPGRWRRQRKAYALTPWEGHFSDYRRHQGILVPSCGEVGWYVDGQLEIVWKGQVTSFEYELEHG